MSIKVSAVQMNLESSINQNMEKIKFFIYAPIFTSRRAT